MEPKTSLLHIKKNLELDARNWWEANNQLSFGYDFSKRCPKEISKKIKNKKWGETKDFLKVLIKKKYKANNGFNFLKNEFLSYWNKKEKEIIHRLDKIHQNKFPVKFVNIYYTSFKRCPYGKEGEGFWIQLNEFNKDNDFLAEIIIHELMHLYFLKYYKKICLKERLSNDEIEDIKEAFTILINTEFEGVLNLKDEGYDSHKNLRKFISNKWLKSRNFKKVLLLAIQYVKKREHLNPKPPAKNFINRYIP